MKVANGCATIVDLSVAMQCREPRQNLRWKGLQKRVCNGLNGVDPLHLSLVALYKEKEVCKEF